MYFRPFLEVNFPMNHNVCVSVGRSVRNSGKCRLLLNLLKCVNKPYALPSPMTCSQHVHHILSTCSQHVHDMFTTCSRHAHNMFTTCSQHVHHMPSPSLSYSLLPLKKSCSFPPQHKCVVTLTASKIYRLIS